VIPPDQWDQSGQIGFGLVHPKKPNANSFQVLEGKLSRLKCEICVGPKWPIRLSFPLAFLFYLYSCNLFCWRALKTAAAEWRCFHSCCGRENMQCYSYLHDTLMVATLLRIGNRAPTVAGCFCTCASLLFYSLN